VANEMQPGCFFALEGPDAGRVASKAKFTNAFHQVTLLLAITEFAAEAAASKV